MAIGWLPTLMGFPGRPVAVLTGVTIPQLCQLTTKAIAPSGVIAMAAGP